MKQPHLDRRIEVYLIKTMVYLIKSRFYKNCYFLDMGENKKFPKL